MHAAAPEASHAASTPSEASGRSSGGRFAPGNPGGPGRPPKTLPIEREVIALLARAISPEDWANVAQAAVRKAVDGNTAALQLLFRTFLHGRLNAAAAAEAIGLPAEVEMFELGCQQHAGWAKLVQETQRAAHQPAAQAAAAPSAAPTPDQPGVPRDDASDQRPAAPAPHQPAASTTLVASSFGSAVVTPFAERVQGFRVTKGVRRENRRNRRNAAKSPGLCSAG